MKKPSVRPQLDDLQLLTSLYSQRIEALMAYKQQEMVVNTILVEIAAYTTHRDPRVLRQLLDRRDEILTAAVVRFKRLKRELTGGDGRSERLEAHCYGICECIQKLATKQDNGQALREFIQNNGGGRIDEISKLYDHVDTGGRQADPARYELANAWHKLHDEQSRQDDALIEVMALRRQYEQKAAHEGLSDDEIGALEILRTIKRPKQAADRRYRLLKRDYSREMFVRTRLDE